MRALLDSTPLPRARRAALWLLALSVAACGSNRGDPVGDAATPAPIEAQDSGPGDAGSVVALHSDGDCAIVVTGAIDAFFEECESTLQVEADDGGSYLFALAASAAITLADGGAATVGLGITASGSGSFSPGLFASGGATFLDIALDESDHATFHDLWSASFDPENPGDASGSPSLTLSNRGSVDYSGPLPGSTLGGDIFTLYSGTQGSLDSMTGPPQAILSGSSSASDSGVAISGTF